SSIYPPGFDRDWNRSYLLMPAGEIKGAVVLLHGLTDTPYSLRHIARLYQQLGFVAVGIRLPAHGTVPAALTKVRWQEWLAATKLAVREAHHLSGNNKPLHLVGFSNGGALAVEYTLESLEDPGLPRPDQLVLLSPMIGVTSFARFAGLAGLPSIFPPFAKAAWLSILPEFNPFKYNSFPVNAARQTHLLTRDLQQRIVRLGRENRLAQLPPIITFQSVVDFTVSTRAVITALYNHLPANGSEVVLFDINRTTNFDLLLRPSTLTAIRQQLPLPPRRYQATMISNRSPDDEEVVARSINAGETTEHITPLGIKYPADLFSLSHVAIPFPPDDPLYGNQPGRPYQYGINLGALAVRGERSVLIVDLDTLLRASSNPFYTYMMQRIEQDIQRSLKKKG
ncbi:MAG: alpha/beta hydrolase, partial [Enterobacteriaceae bacterium]